MFLFGRKNNFRADSSVIDNCNPGLSVYLCKKIQTVNALIIVDVQKDFCPGGSLGTKKGNNIIPIINDLTKKFDLIVATKDWHPATTVHFDKWPIHCVRGTEGAQFHSGLSIEKISEVALKGTGNTDDGYSGFEATNIDLQSWLNRQKVSDVYLCGIATEYCVMATAMDAHRMGFRTFVVEDAIAAVEAKDGDTQKALKNMASAGIRFTKSAQL